jgi:hypothetical protein
MKQDTKTQGKKPFFARLLETQELEQVTGAGGPITLKYPSDKDAEEQTLKYPSDTDEG